MDNLERWKAELQQMRDQVVWLESGKAKFGEMTATGWVDTTADEIADYKRKIAQLDGLIARHSEDK